MLGVMDRTLTNWERRGLLVPLRLPTGCGQSCFDDLHRQV